MTTGLNKAAILATIATVLIGTNVFALIADTPYPTALQRPARIASYNVKFYAWGDREVVVKDEAGNPLGKVADGQFVQINVSPETHDSSITPQGVSVRTLLSKIPTLSTPSGSVYPTVLSQPTRMSNGKVLPAGTKVYADLRDFYVNKSLQPSSSSGGDPVKSRMFAETLATTGVTKETRPTSAPQHISGRVPLDPKVQAAAERELDPHAGHRHEEVEGDEADQYDRVDPVSSMPAKFLSAPICECKRSGGCGLRNDQSFGAPRRSKRSGKRRIHAGQDIYSGKGTPVVAAAYGCIDSVGSRGGYGRIITMKHGNGLTTSYAHLSRFAKDTREGRCFDRGEIIGYSGDSGSPGQPHLHFEVRVNGAAKNPRNYMIETSNDSFNRRSCAVAARQTQDRYAAIDSLIVANVNPRVQYARSTPMRATGAVN
ncbi:MAG TPA: M23 family metallopeptidase [Bdellovibrionales bacterium]|nr:M23 family metallopeptidase [Bdellovibrionales bacterium]